VLIENEFQVPTPADQLWDHLLDVQRIAPCMPGAELTEVVDERRWKGRLKMKLGPVAMAFVGTVTMEERDDDARRVVLKAQGMESKGKGAATATVTSWLEPGDGVTTVKMQADISLSGFVAQVSRGMLPDVSAKLTRQFADCLQAGMTSGGPAASEAAAAVEAPSAAEEPEAGAPAAKPVGGIRLGLWSLLRAIRRGLARLFGKPPEG
jgi:uncharacterized protein